MSSANRGEGQAGPEDEFTSLALRLVTADNPVTSVAAALRASEAALANRDERIKSLIGAYEACNSERAVLEAALAEIDAKHVKALNDQSAIHAREMRNVRSELATMTKEREEATSRAKYLDDELARLALEWGEKLLASRAEATKAEEDCVCKGSLDDLDAGVPEQPERDPSLTEEQNVWLLFMHEATIRAPQPPEPETPLQKAARQGRDYFEVVPEDPHIDEPPNPFDEAPSSPPPPTSTLGLSGYVRMGVPPPPSEEPK